MRLTLAALVLVAGFAFSANAEEPVGQDHQKHHAADSSDDKMHEGMMNHEMMGGKMNMGQMHAMMGDCMKMHKDGKMCEGQLREQCQKNMDKDECSKMMKKMKKKDIK